MKREFARERERERDKKIERESKSAMGTFRIESDGCVCVWVCGSDRKMC